MGKDAHSGNATCLPPDCTLMMAALAQHNLIDLLLLCVVLLQFGGSSVVMVHASGLTLQAVRIGPVDL